ncbi:MAG: T9SS type A sorting domain-containing protein [Bacteroidales bacterium]|nr:T9SS type A sorting domain-containing protein [Bacteroidales bacterium]
MKNILYTPVKYGKIGVITILMIFNFSIFAQKEFYIDPDYKGSLKEGTISNPFIDFPTTLVSNSKYLLKSGSVLKSVKRYNWYGSNNITFGVYAGIDKASIVFDKSLASRLFFIVGANNRIENLNFISENMDSCRLGERDPRQATVLELHVSGGNGYLNNLFIKGGFRGFKGGNAGDTTSKAFKGKIEMNNVHIDSVQHDGIYITYLDSLIINKTTVTNSNLSVIANPLDSTYKDRYGGDCLQVGEVYQIVIDSSVFDHSTTKGKYSIITTGYKKTTITNSIVKSYDGEACIYPGGNSIPDSLNPTKMDNSFISTWDLRNCIIEGGKVNVQNRCRLFLATNCVFRDALIAGVDAGYTLDFRNCLFVEMDTAIINWRNDTLADGEFKKAKNCIFYKIGKPFMGTAMTGNNNLFFNPGRNYSSTDVTKYLNFLGKDFIMKDPLFVSEASRDYRILKESPCIDAGNIIYNDLSYDFKYNKRVSGNGIDIGPFEYTADDTATIDELIVFEISGGGTFCKGEDVSITLNGSEKNVFYQLYNGDNAINSPVAGNGKQIVFNSIVSSGLYSILAKSLTGSAAKMKGSLNINVKENPIAYTILGVGGTCDMVSDYIDVVVENTQVGVEYILWSNELPTSQVYIGNGEKYVFKNLASSNTYKVEGVVNGCSQFMKGYVTGQNITGIESVLLKDTSICLPAKINLVAGSNNQTYKWSTGEITSSITKTVSKSETVFVTITNGSCSTIDSVIIKANPVSAFSLGKDLTIALGDTTVIKGPDNMKSYLWSNGSKIKDIEIFESTKIGRFVYSLLASNEFDCKYSDTININIVKELIFYPKTFSITGGGVICAGDSLNIVVSSSEQETEYQILNGTIPVGLPVIGSGNTMTVGSIKESGTYTVRATNFSGRSVMMTGTVEVSVTQAPQVFNLQGDGNYCKGELGASLSLSNSESKVSYQLFRGEEKIGEPILVNLGGRVIKLGTQSIEGEYKIIASLGECSVVMKNSVNVKENNYPLSTLVKDTIICLGNTISIDPGIAALYSWNNGSKDRILTVKNAGEYIVEMKNANCAIYDTIDVIADRFDTLLDIYTFCKNEELALVCGVGKSYKWNTQETSQKIIVNKPGIYIVTITTDDCSSVDSTEVKELSLPNLNLGPDQIISFSKSVTLDASSDYKKYLWSTGETSSSIEINGEIGEVKYLYSLKVTDQNNCSAVDSIAIQIVNDTIATPAKFNIAYKYEKCIDSSTTLTLSNSELNTTYQIYKENIPYGLRIEGAGKEIILGTINKTGNYKVVAANKSGITQVMNSPFYIDFAVNPKPFEVFGGGNICENSTGLPIELKESEANVSYYILKNQEIIDSVYSTTSGNLLFGEYAEKGVYTITAKKNSCYQNMVGSAQINIDLFPKRSLPNKIFECEDDFISITASIAQKYLWNTGDTGNVLELENSGLYTVRMSNGACSIIDSCNVTFVDYQSIYKTIEKCSYVIQKISAPDAQSYLWSNGETRKDIYVVDAGTYYLTTTYNGCEFYDSVKLSNYPDISFSLGNDTTISRRQSLLLSGPKQEGLSYLWKNGNTSSELKVDSSFNLGLNIISLLVLDSHGCYYSDSLEVVVTNEKPIFPSVYAISGIDKICKNATTSINLTTSEIGTKYELIKDDVGTGIFKSGTGDELVFDSIGSIGTYKVRATNDLGYSIYMNGSIILTYHIMPLEHELIGSGSICINGSNEASISLNTIEFGVEYSLFLNYSQLIASKTSSGEKILFDGLNKEGTYSVTAKNNFCTTQMKNSVSLKTQDFSEINLLGDTIICENSKINLVQKNADSYLWNTGETSNTIAVYKEGIYYVEMKKYGCVLTDTIEVSYLKLEDMERIITSCEKTPLIVSCSKAETYRWNTGETTQNIIVKNAGIYHVTATKSNCKISDSVYVQYFSSPVINFGNDTTIVIKSGSTILRGPDGMSSYEWNTGERSNTIEVSYLQPEGKYEVILHVIDTNNCSTFEAINFNFIRETVDSYLDFDLSASAFPNPTEGIVYIDVRDFQIENYTIEVVSSVGALLNKILQVSSNPEIIEIDLTKYANGTYYIYIHSNKLNLRYKIVLK